MQGQKSIDSALYSNNSVWPLNIFNNKKQSRKVRFLIPTLQSWNNGQVSGCNQWTRNCTIVTERCKICLCQKVPSDIRSMFWFYIWKWYNYISLLQNTWNQLFWKQRLKSPNIPLGTINLDQDCTLWKKATRNEISRPTSSCLSASSAYLTERDSEWVRGRKNERGKKPIAHILVVEQGQPPASTQYIPPLKIKRIVDNSQWISHSKIFALH